MRSRFRKSVNVNVDVDVDVLLDEVDPNDLIDALEFHGVIDAATAKAMKAKRPVAADPIMVDAEPYDEALWHLRAGRRAEALAHLERALPREWRGALS